MLIKQIIIMFRRVLKRVYCVIVCHATKKNVCDYLLCILS